MHTLRTSFLAVLTVAVISSSATAARYTIDQSHSSVGFKVRHMVVSKTAGTFNRFSGWFDYDAKDKKGKKWNVEAVIEMDSIDTGNDDRDNHLRNSDFFDTENHPTMTFKFEKIKVKKGTKYLIGKLTMRGVTNKVELVLEENGTVKGRGGKMHAGFSATGMINRKDYGVSYGKVLETGGLAIGNEVQISLEIEGVEEIKNKKKKKSKK